MHGMPVPLENEGVGDGEKFFGIIGAEWDDVMQWAREVLRPC